MEDKYKTLWTDEMIEGLVEDGTIIDYVKESNDRYRIVIDPRFDIEVDEGEYYAVRRKKEYPKTYEECCEILEDVADCSLSCFACGVLNNLQKLLLCRDAYWKIAGEEVGLGKPWEPDWREKRYIIYRNQDVIIRGYRAAGCVEQHIFEFPTEEMRDAFYENFKVKIEICKELL